MLPWKLFRGEHEYAVPGSYPQMDAVLVWNRTAGPKHGIWSGPVLAHPSSWGAAALERPARANGRAGVLGNPFWVAFVCIFYVFDLFLWVSSLGRQLIFFLVKFHVECRQNHV